MKILGLILFLWPIAALAWLKREEIKRDFWFIIATLGFAFVVIGSMSLGIILVAGG